MTELKISIKDDASARQWLNKVMLTNDEYYEAMREAGATLQEAKDFGEGTMVDEFYNLGTNVLTTATVVFNTINEISTVVNDVLGKVGNLKETVAGAINVVKNIFG